MCVHCRQLPSLTTKIKNSLTIPMESLRKNAISVITINFQGFPIAAAAGSAFTSLTITVYGHRPASAYPTRNHSTCSASTCQSELFNFGTLQSE
jgi:hypothetical protein